MAVFVVTSTFDNANAVSGDGSLRGEILASNATTTSNEIDFSLPSGVQTIALKAPLPAIRDQLLINGSTATGFTKAPLIQITGLNPTFVASGPAFTINAGGSELRDLLINDFDGDAVDLDGGTARVDGCYIGVDPTGTKSVGSTQDGILIDSRANTIGGGVALSPNVISGNGGNQIEINGNNATQNLIVNSYIGTNAAGTAALFSGIPGDGITVSTANNTIGGGGTLALGLNNGGNLISGNQEGLVFFTGATGNVAQDNFIGTDATGLVAVPNVDFGVYVTGGTRNTIGGVNGLFNELGNVISGNGNDGVRIQGSTSTNNQVQGNDIGVGADGTTAVGNGHWGVQINAASQNLVGGSVLGGDAPGYGNTIQHNDTLGGAGGVTIVSATGDGILSNSIYQNGTGPGILLNAANNGVRAPVITSVQSGAGQTLVSGTYAGTPGLTYTLQFFSSPMANVSGVGDGQSYLLADLPVTTNSLGTANFNAVIKPMVPVGFFVTATATQGVLVMNNTSNFSTAVLSTQAAVTDLAVATAVPTTGPQLDQPYLYTLTVTNNGPNAATGVVLTDTLPTNSTVISTSGGTVTSGVLTDNIGPLASGASVTVLLTVKPTSVGAFVNTATVTGAQLDANSTNNTSTTTSTVVANSDLQVSLTAGVNVAPVGSPITYTLSIGNNGPSTATGTVTTVQFPADFTNIVVQPDQGSYTISSTNLVTIMTGIVPASSASNVTIMATPTAVEQAVTTAAVSSPIADPNTANNTASATVIVGNAADLAVTLSANPNPVLVNGLLTYTIVVTNNGPSIATMPVVYDTLPAGVSFDGLASNAGPNGILSASGNAITVNLQPLAAGDTDTITLAGTAIASGLTTNTVLVADPTLAQSNEIDPDPTNNTATLTVPVSPADISVNVVNPNDPLVLGGNAVFQVQVLNSGPSTATNVVLNDQFTNATIVAASAGPFFGPSLLTNLGSIPSGATETVYIVVRPNTAGSLTDSALVEADQYDPDPSNNSSSTTNIVSPADLSISVAGSTAPVLFGTPIIFVATVTNNGPTPATNVLFGDLLPANEYFGAVVASQGSVAPNALYNELVGNLGTLAPGASATVVFYVTPLGTGPQATSVAVSSDDFDPNPANNTASFAIQVINPPGTIQFATTFQDVADTAGSISLLLTRTNGTGGAVSVNYSTENFTALAGVNYVATAGTVTFQPGQVYALITIPVLDDGVIGQTTGFFVGLSSPTGGASIGPNSGSGIVVVNTDRDLIPPIVTQLIALPNGNTITGFAISFDKPMDPTRAQLLSNYYVFLSGSGAVNVGTPVALAAAHYNAENNTVILVPTAPLPSNRFYEVLLNGSVGYALTDISGNVLYGSTGPNTNYVAYYGQGTQLVYDDSQNNVVTLNLTGGGLMGIYRNASGDATQVNLYGIVPHSSKLTGSVVKLNKYGTGHTNIGAIYGLGAFGDVNSTLTTPEFYVGSAPLSATSIGAGVPVPLTVSADSVTTTSVTAKKATPKGPLSKG